MSSKKFEPYQLHVGDLCVYVGQPEHSQMKPGIIYQVVVKEQAPQTSFSDHRYKFRAVFDITNPTGFSMDLVAALGTHKLRKLTLLDLGTLRLHLDNFIKDWANAQGEEGSDDGEAPTGDPSEGGPEA